MSRTRWIVTSLLTACLVLVGSSDQGAAARKPGDQFVGMTTCGTSIGPLYFAVSSNGTVYDAGLENPTGNILSFQPIGNVPPGPVNISTGLQPRIYIGYANGDLYEANLNNAPPWTFTLVKNVFTP